MHLYVYPHKAWNEIPTRPSLLLKKPKLCTELITIDVPVKQSQCAENVYPLRTSDVLIVLEFQIGE